MALAGDRCELFGHVRFHYCATLIMRAAFQAITGLALIGAAFGGGMALQSYFYQDACLDMGGGQNPGNHPICVVVKQPDWITIGPLTLKPDQAKEVSVTTVSEGTSAVTLKISALATHAITGLLTAARGQEISVSVGETVVSEVIVQEAISNSTLVFIMSNEDASRLAGVY
ncbi:hypothetical protein ACFMPD_11625 [Sedimentitalea sp. HM32M-2]|uniref:hypothetical protein n=1 Tax=Sedimentitalea sp. HM32M-2 TaxID=3351566 RepID=UPI00362FE8BB